ncbi:MAG: YciI family protein [Thermoanaerobaculia bacterium]
MPHWKTIAVALVFAASSLPAETPPEKPQPGPGYDAALAARLGADEHGMRSYVLVILRTGPTRVPDGPERDAMFAGHFANMKRLAAEGKLIAAGPLDGVDGWRGMFVFAEKEIEAAAKLVATDPVIVRGEMVAEYHKYYGSAGLMLVPETHERVTKESF